MQEGDRFVTGDTLVSVGIAGVREASGTKRWGGKAEQEQREIESFRGKVRGKGLAVMIKTTMTPSNSSALVQAQRATDRRFC